ncbi:hypothetical protein PTSG_00099 [Salpingoeca rosetta]|uniref:Uncharacterized protein n=1 Tax=Salpingoeca rosetta (strain ATCC 50818 / BSB-021) TaxID=946362 RepID=F2TVI6_SALR5|nr:uncharacterized protein PTSG_00099 [Salpingoeca rosetta]EGD72082.1 hypothetical protein PTSG_00099 [Salpingoeca rosetta]|eukprot:XP_004998654.1 hypothetical protein PTSG_00099 [Salpingoeca rosetta]
MVTLLDTLQQEVERLQQRLKAQREAYEKQFEDLEHAHEQELQDMEARYRHQLQRHIDAFKETVLFHQQHHGGHLHMDGDTAAATTTTTTTADLMTSLLQDVMDTTASMDPASSPRSKASNTSRLLSSAVRTANGDDATHHDFGDNGTDRHSLQREMDAMQARHAADMEQLEAAMERQKRQHQQLLADETARADTLQAEVDALNQRIDLLDSALAAKQDVLDSVRAGYERDAHLREQAMQQLEAQLQDLAREQKSSTSTRTAELQRALDDKAALHADLARAKTRVAQLQRMLKQLQLPHASDTFAATATTPAATQHLNNTTLGFDEQGRSSTMMPVQSTANLSSSSSFMAATARHDSTQQQAQHDPLSQTLPASLSMKPDGPAAAAFARSTEYTVRALLHNRTQLQEEIARLKQELTQVRASKIKLVEDLTKDREELKQRHAQHVTEVQSALDSNATQLTGAHSTLAALEEALDRQYNALMAEQAAARATATRTAPTPPYSHHSGGNASATNSNPSIGSYSSASAAMAAAAAAAADGVRPSTMVLLQSRALPPAHVLASAYASTSTSTSTTASLSSSASVPQQHLMAVLNAFGKVRTALDNISVEFAQLSRKHEMAQQELIALRSQVAASQTRCHDLSTQEQETKGAMDALRAQCATLQSQKESLERHNADMTRHLQAAQRRAGELEAEADRAASEAQSRLQRSEDDAKQRVAGVQQQVKAFKAELQSALGVKTAVESQLGEALRDNMKLREETERLAKTATEQEATARRLQERHDFSLERAKKLEQELASTKTAKEHAEQQLHALQAEADALRSRAQETDRAVQTANAEQAALQQQAAKLRGKVAVLKQKNEALSDAETQLQAALVARDAAHSEIAQLRRQIADTHARKEQAEEEAQRTAHANRAVVDDLTRQLQVARTRARNAEEAVSALAEKAQHFETRAVHAERDARAARDESEHASTQLHDLQQQLSSKEREAAKLKREYAELQYRVDRLYASNQQLLRDRRTQHARLLDKMKRHFASQMTSLSTLGKYGSGRATPAGTQVTAQLDKSAGTAVPLHAHAMTEREATATSTTPATNTATARGQAVQFSAEVAAPHDHHHDNQQELLHQQQQQQQQQQHQRQHQEQEGPEEQEQQGWHVGQQDAGDGTHEEVATARVDVSQDEEDSDESLRSDADEDVQHLLME